MQHPGLGPVRVGSARMLLGGRSRHDEEVSSCQSSPRRCSIRGSVLCELAQPECCSVVDQGMMVDAVGPAGPRVSSGKRGRIPPTRPEGRLSGPEDAPTTVDAVGPAGPRVSSGKRGRIPPTRPEGRLSGPEDCVRTSWSMKSMRLPQTCAGLVARAPCRTAQACRHRSACVRTSWSMKSMRLPQTCAGLVARAPCRTAQACRARAAAQTGGAAVSIQAFDGVEVALSRYSYLVSLFECDCSSGCTDWGGRGVDTGLRRCRGRAVTLLVPGQLVDCSAWAVTVATVVPVPQSDPTPVTVAPAVTAARHAGGRLFSLGGDGGNGGAGTAIGSNAGDGGAGGDSSA